jgi:S1-C subfamily serine protease
MQEDIREAAGLDRKYVAALAAIAAGVILFGVFFRPERKAPQITTTEAETRQLTREARRRTSEDLRVYFASVAQQAGQRLVSVSRGGAGVPLDNNTVVAVLNARVGEHLEVRASDGRPVSVRVESLVPDLSLAVLRAAGASFTPVERRPPQPPSGQWTVQVTLRPDLTPAFAPVLFAGSSPAKCAGLLYDEMQTTSPLAASMAGGGLFDTSGRLLGVVIRCHGRLSAMSLSDVRAAAEQALSPAGRTVARFGFRVIQVEEGIAISEVYDRSVADRAGFEPGQVITQAGQTAISSMDELHAALASADPVDLRIGRRTVRLDAAGAFDEPVVLQRPETGPRVEEVVAGSPFERAGILAGDILLSVDGRRTSDLERLLGRSGRHYVVIRRDGRRIGVTVEP